jgi:hypothetical protein
MTIWETAGLIIGELLLVIVFLFAMRRWRG